MILLELEGNNLYNGTINVPNVNLWWPVDMNESPGYMYTLKVSQRPETILKYVSITVVFPRLFESCKF